MKSSHKSIDRTNTTPLHEACLQGDLEEVLRLKNENLDEFMKMLLTPDYNSDLPLDRAAARGHHEIVKLLIDLHKSKPEYAYVMHSRELYNPMLSAVRWYCKVMDETYDKGILLGKFNTGKSYHEDYLAIIKMVIANFPHLVGSTDKKTCNSMYYAILHFAEAEKAGKKNDAQHLRNLICVINDADPASVDMRSSTSGKTPRELAKESNLIFTRIRVEKENVSISIQPAKSTITSENLFLGFYQEMQKGRGKPSVNQSQKKFAAK